MTVCHVVRFPLSVSPRSDEPALFNILLKASVLVSQHLGFWLKWRSASFIPHPPSCMYEKLRLGNFGGCVEVESGLSQLSTESGIVDQKTSEAYKCVSGARAKAKSLNKCHTAQSDAFKLMI